MRQKKRSTGFVLKTLGVFALLMAVSGLSALSFAPYPHELNSHARLAVDTPGAATTSTPDTSATAPGAAATDTPDTSASVTPIIPVTETPGVLPPGDQTPGDQTPSATTTPGMMTETPGTSGQPIYIGEIPSPNHSTNMTWVAISSSNGQQMTAFVTDGTKDHPPTFAYWYNGTLQNNKFAAPAGLPNSGKIEATVTQDTATGTITLPNGKTLPFTADMLQSSSLSLGAGLYKSEQVVNGVDYVVGWILAPNPATNPSATQTPGATGTAPIMGSPAATSTAPIIGSPTAPIIGSPTAPVMGTPATTETPGILPTGEASPGATTSPTGATGISGLVQAGAIFNKQTKAVTPVPELTLQNLQSKQVTLPNLGEFNLMQCQGNMC